MVKILEKDEENERGVKKLQKKLPKIKSHVSGFKTSITRKSGCVLQSRPKDSPDGTPYKNIGVDEHFEIAVTYSGDNYKFPPDAKRRWKYLLTNALRTDYGSGFHGHICFQPLDGTFTEIEVVEEYENYQGSEGMGRRPSPEMVVWIKVHTKTPDGQMSHHGFGIADRPLTEQDRTNMRDVQ